MKVNTSAVLAGALLLATGHASAVVINFDNLAEGAILSTQYSALGVTFSPNAFTGAGSSTSGANWATNTDMTIVDLAGGNIGVGGVGTPTLLSGKILRSFSGWINEDGDPSLTIAFSAPVNSFSVDFGGATTPGDVRIFAYNGATLLGMAFGTVTTGQFTLSFNAAAITSVAVAPGSFDDWVGMDNVNFTLAPIPEASTYAMWLAGLGAVGFLARRRR